MIKNSNHFKTIKKFGVVFIPDNPLVGKQAHKKKLNNDG